MHDSKVPPVPFPGGGEVVSGGQSKGMILNLDEIHRENPRKLSEQNSPRRHSGYLHEHRWSSKLFGKHSQSVSPSHGTAALFSFLVLQK